MIPFTTETVSVKRLTATTGNKKEHAIVITGLPIDIQPNSPEAFGSDIMFEGFRGFVSTNDKNLIVYNDQLLSELDNIVYYVKGTQFYQGNGVLDDSLELILSTDNTN